MKTRQLAILGVGVCIAAAVGVWLSSIESPDQIAKPIQPADLSQGKSMSAGAPTSDNVVRAEVASNKADEANLGAKLEVLMAQVMLATQSPAEGEAAREKLRNMAKEDAAVARWLIQSYDKPFHSRSRGLIISLLFEIETPEVLAFSKRLATSSQPDQQRDGFVLLQNLPNDLPEVRPIILQTLSANQSTESVLLALAALKPPAPNGDATSPNVSATAYSTALVTALQNLTRNPAPEVRIESLLQLAQRDQTGGSQEHWANALADPAPRVREAALVAIAQAGAKSERVKSALLGMANNPKESNDVRGSALQVLEGIAVSKEEARDLAKLRAQIPGL